MIVNYDASSIPAASLPCICVIIYDHRVPKKDWSMYKCVSPTYIAMSI